MSGNFHRRQVIVDKKLQIGLALKILGCLTAYLLLFGLLTVFGPYMMLILGDGVVEADVLTATDDWIALGKSVAIPLLLTFTCLSLHCILLSHRIAGPIYRIKLVLTSVLGGDLTASFRLRKDDYLKDLAAALDTTIGNLRKDMASLKEQAHSIVDDLAEENVADAAEKTSAMLEVLDAYRLEAEVEPQDAAETPEPVEAAG